MSVWLCAKKTRKNETTSFPLFHHSTFPPFHSSTFPPSPPLVSLAPRVPRVLWRPLSLSALNDERGARDERREFSTTRQLQYPSGPRGTRDPTKCAEGFEITSIGNNLSETTSFYGGQPPPQPVGVPPFHLSTPPPSPPLVPRDSRPSRPPRGHCPAGLE